MNKLALPMTLLSILLLSGCGNQSAKHADSSQQSTSSKVVSSKKASQQTTTSQSSTSSTSSTSASTSSSSSMAVADNSSTVKQFVAGQDFKIEPVLYNGQPVNKAMDEQKAPQNTVHDYTVLVNFDQASKATTQYIGEIRPEHKSYTVANDTLTLGKYHIPFSTNGKAVTFLPWKASDGQGGTITYKFTNQ
ncbi:hypothetical protein IWT140_01829 [Secundilactobacillus pentosiphilus]|uniref:Lipoprotein n=1 Tax=Secundilactobacillus pentosiphilus TaxID=1714682 RepID=A0A1Z5IRZ1_9LACO|nr:hypothetical protein [Secundilactobacillus pentosiphilus]GAX04191.1 hypothetical protein IWT140_01829 [Secundilactobacillus pentosiphilus]